MAWVKAGAVWPKTAGLTATKSEGGKYVIKPEMRNFWSFQPLKEVQAPRGKGEGA